MQTKCIYRNGCVLFSAHISSDKGKDVKDVEILKRYVVLKKFEEMFLVYISEFRPHREVEFYIDLVPREEMASKETYRMNTL